MTSGFTFFILLILCVVALIAFLSLQGRVTALQIQLLTLKKRLDELADQKTVPVDKTQSDESNSLKNPSTPTVTNTVISKPLVAPSSMTTNIVNQPIQSMVPTPQASQLNPVTPPQNSKTMPNRVADENSLGHRFIQWLVKGNPVAKVAIIILFFGLSYLLKYSIDHGLLSPQIRILGSLALGIALLTIGWRLRIKKSLYALILQGGAIGVIYLTLFAAFKLYGLVPLLLTFALLIIICATSIMFAILQRAISLAIIACVGGYLAPILLSTGSGNHIALFSYYLLISTAILIISFWQSWRLLNLIGFVFTFVVAMLWGYRSFQAPFYIECQIFILANMLIYGVLAVLLSVRNQQKEPYQNVLDLILLFSVPLTAFSLQYAITQQWQYAPAFSALGFGLFYLVGSFVVLRVWRQQAKHLALYGLAIGLGFSTLAVPLALTANWTAIVWLIEGTTISYAALSQKQYRFAWAGALIVILGAISALFANVTYINDVNFITLYGVMSAIILFNGCLWHHYRNLDASSDGIKLLFIIIAIISWSTWIIQGVVRIDQTTSYVVQPIIACYVIAVWLWFVIGRKIDWPLLRYAVIALWPVLALALANNILFYLHTYYAGLWGLSWLAAFISAYCYLYFDKDNLKDNQQLSMILHISLLWIVLAWLYYEINGMLTFLPWGFDVIKWSVLTVFTSVIILVFFLLSQYRRFPIHGFAAQYWKIGLLPVGFYLAFKLVTGLYSSGQIIYWTYVPFINPLEEAAVLGLMMFAIWLNQLVALTSGNQKMPTTSRQHSVMAVLFIITLTFLWSNSVILRSLSQWLEISWSFYALWHNNIVQVVLSLVWTLSAVILIAIAHRYLLRNVWFIGAILQVIVVLKLIIIDSVELDGLMRAFAFIGVALLMLVIGYLAPLPPKNNKKNPLQSIDSNVKDHRASIE